MSLSTFNTELDIFLLIFYIPIAVKSFKTITTGLYFCSIQKESIVKENLKTIKCPNIYDLINVKHQTIKPTLIPIWSRGQMEICGLFWEFVAPPGKRNLVAIMAQRHVFGT